MRLTAKWISAVGIALTLALPNCCWAKSSLEGRLSRLERLVQGQLNVNVLNQVEALQQELRDLRGVLEEQEHALKLLNKRQEQLYADLDVRLNKVKIANGAQDVPATQPTKAPAKAAKADKGKQPEKFAYDMAYQLMDTKKYAQAITAFQDFLWQHPDGKYAPNAHYWLGEVYLAQWNENRTDDSLVQKAVSSFETVVSKYQNHHKAVDALLKLGLIEVDKENWQAAKSLLTRVSSEYPDSSRARIAETRLQRLEQEGKF